MKYLAKRRRPEGGSSVPAIILPGGALARQGAGIHIPGGPRPTQVRRNARTSERAGNGLTLLAGALILAAAAVAPVLGLPASIVIMVVLVGLLLAWHLSAAWRANR